MKKALLLLVLCCSLGGQKACGMKDAAHPKRTPADQATSGRISKKIKALKKKGINEKDLFQHLEEVVKSYVDMYIPLDTAFDAFQTPHFLKKVGDTPEETRYKRLFSMARAHHKTETGKKHQNLPGAKRADLFQVVYQALNNY